MRPRRWLRFYNGWEGPAGEPHQTEIVYLWEKGWVEPVKPPASPNYVRIQQALCFTLQNRAVPLDELTEFVSQNVLDHLLANGFLVKDGSSILIGPQTEKLYGKRNFLELLSVFDTPPRFLAEFNGKEIGWIHELTLQPRRDGSDPIILLSGRAWRVRFVNWTIKVVSVEPSESEGRSR